MTTPLVLTGGVPVETHVKLLAVAINEILKGRANVAGSFTLTENTTTTTVTDNLFNSDMVPKWVPTSANAAAEIGAGTMYLSARANGSFTITHANNAQTDRTFLYVRWG